MNLVLFMSVVLIPLIESASLPVEPPASNQRVMQNGPKLAIKTIKAAGKQRSDLYEIYQISPFRYIEKEKRAVVIINSPQNNITGLIYLSQKVPPAGSLELRGMINGLKPGKHGIHVNKLGDIGERCMSTGPHYNPYNFNHGSPSVERRHAGDLGNIEADVDGVAEFNLTDRMLSLTGSRSIIGRSIVIDYVEDDFDKHRGRERTDSKTAVFPAACGVVGLVD